MTNQEKYTQNIPKSEVILCKKSYQYSEDEQAYKTRQRQDRTIKKKEKEKGNKYKKKKKKRDTKENIFKNQVTFF